MPDLRQDPISGRWVIIAENRARRPIEFEPAPVRRASADCPFCAGKEHETPAAVAEYSLFQAPGRGRWQVRVVPNKYPAVNGHGQLLPSHESFYEALQPIGVHEVVIESPLHQARLTELSPEELQLVMFAYQDRLRNLSARPELRYGVVFKNNGPTAGASLEHLHSQLIATPMLPWDVQTELDRVQRHYEQSGRCIYCDLFNAELTGAERLVEQTPDFIVFCPFASRFSHEMWIMPRRHTARFESLADEDLFAVSRLVHRAAGRIEQLLDGPAYNLLVRTAPFDTNSYQRYHWHIEIFPRLAAVAGFELATGCYINSTPPESAAASLRGVLTAN